MPLYTSTRLVPFTPAQMFALVADIEKYPQFVPMCSSLIIQSRHEEAGLIYLTATMGVEYKLLRESFTCRVTLDEAAHKISVDYLSGPFKRLDNKWEFTPHAKGCEVNFTLDYEFKSRAFGVLASMFIDRSFKLFAQKFEERAKIIYTHHL
jgi:coenzyme Q-binding protein COQ10